MTTRPTSATVYAPPAREPTVGELRAAGTLLDGECLDCGRGRKLDPRKMAAPDTITLRRLASMMRCRECSGNFVRLVPATTTSGDQPA
jgi:hypothetical protein